MQRRVGKGRAEIEVWLTNGGLRPPTNRAELRKVER